MWLGLWGTWGGGTDLPELAAGYVYLQVSYVTLVTRNCGVVNITSVPGEPDSHRLAQSWKQTLAGRPD